MRKLSQPRAIVIFLAMVVFLAAVAHSQPAAVHLSGFEVTQNETVAGGRLLHVELGELHELLFCASNQGALTHVCEALEPGDVADFDSGLQPDDSDLGALGWLPVLAIHVSPQLPQPEGGDSDEDGKWAMPKNNENGGLVMPKNSEIVEKILAEKWEVRDGWKNQRPFNECMLRKYRTFSVTVNLKGSRKAAPFRISGQTLYSGLVDAQAAELVKWLNDPARTSMWPGPAQLGDGAKITVTKAGRAMGFLPVGRV